MIGSCRSLRIMCVGAATIIGLAAVDLFGQSALQEPGDEAKWYFSPGLSWFDFEGDQDYSDSMGLSLGLGYDYNERWTLEGGLLWAPSVDRTDDSAATWSSTHVIGLMMDGLFHFTRWERLDPYLSAGLGYSHYGEEPTKGEQDEMVIRGGGGVMYHFNDEWAVRADFRTMLAGFGGNPNANSVASGGLVWFFGARVPPSWEADSADDPDRDGLTNAEEAKIGTNPLDPDTDKDRLKDGEEVNKYNTDPLNPDTDMDLLKDGDEVYDYTTDPNDRDTDDGGVMDGHEVLEDYTKPQKGHGGDDLVLYELNIEFDMDKAVVKSQYFSKIDVIGKVITRNPGSSARIEGHCDKMWNRAHKSDRKHNLELSQKRAQAVVDYLVTRHKIDRRNLKAVGHGFDRPKVPHDLANPNGTPANRRVEIYIRKGEGADKLILPATGEEAIEPVSRPAPPPPPEPLPLKPASTEAAGAGVKASTPAIAPSVRPEDK